MKSFKFIPFRVLLSLSNLVFLEAFTQLPNYFVQIGESLEGSSLFDYFGFAVSISRDGNRLAVGAPQDDTRAGYVRIFEQTEQGWSPVGNDLHGEGTFFAFGRSVALSPDGNRVVVGSPFVTNEENITIGCVYVYDWKDDEWVITGSRIEGQQGDSLGVSVAMSEDGQRILCGSDTGGIGGYAAAYELSNTSSTWEMLGAPMEARELGEGQGFSVGMSGDGELVAAGAPSGEMGKVRMYRWNVAEQRWNLAFRLDGNQPNDRFGAAVAVSTNGQRVIVGIPSSSEAGYAAGQSRIFDTRDWTQVGAPINGASANDNHGTAVAICANGTSLAIGAHLEDAGEMYSDRGTAQVLVSGDTMSAWDMIDGKLQGDEIRSFFGHSVSLSSNGMVLAVGAQMHGQTRGQVKVFRVDPNPPTTEPSSPPTFTPSELASVTPSVAPMGRGSVTPSDYPSSLPSTFLTARDSPEPSSQPQITPSRVPTYLPTPVPTKKLCRLANKGKMRLGGRGFLPRPFQDKFCD